jgi:hypothetical protein
MTPDTPEGIRAARGAKPDAFKTPAGLVPDMFANPKP